MHTGKKLLIDRYYANKKDIKNERQRKYRTENREEINRKKREKYHRDKLIKSKCVPKELTQKKEELVNPT